MFKNTEHIDYKVKEKGRVERFAAAVRKVMKRALSDEAQMLMDEHHKNFEYCNMYGIGYNGLAQCKEPTRN